MTDPQSEELLLRYLNGKLSREDAVRLRAALDGTTSQRAAGIGLRQVMAAEILERGSPDARESLKRLFDRLDGQENAFWEKSVLQKNLNAEARSLAKNWRGGLFKEQPLRRGIRPVLGACVGMIAVALFSWTIGTHHLGQTGGRSVSKYATGNGERATVTLPDGNTVALNVASRLEVPADFATGNRTVRLFGEGVFTVSHHTGAPFTVISGSATTSVLGTTFLMRHYATDSLTTVVVRQGRVAVRTPSQRVILTVAQQVVMDARGRGVVQAADPARFSFMAGLLVFNGVPFPQAIQELDRWYDADIRLGDPALASEQVAGQYAAGSLADLADILAGTYNLRVVRHGRVLTLFAR